MNHRRALHTTVSLRPFEALLPDLQATEDGRFSLQQVTHAASYPLLPQVEAIEREKVRERGW